MAIKVRKKGNEPDLPEEQSERDIDVAVSIPDPFVGATTSTASWVERNRGLTFGGIALVIVGFIAAFGAVEYLDSQEIQASATLSPAFTAYETPVEGSATYEQLIASEVDVAESFESETERWKTAFDAAEATIAANGAGPLLQSARLAKAAAALRLERWDDAVTAYQDYLSAEPADNLLPFVYQGLASAYAGKGDLEGAREQLKQLQEQGDAYAEIAQYQEAIMLDRAGERDAARDLYHAILEANPTSAYKATIERRLALL